MCDTKLYTIWVHMRERCNYTKHKHYKYYGGRGIKVCKEWDNKNDGFNNFYNDMYESFKKHCEVFTEENTSLDRIDSNMNYEANNCRWATWVQQAENRSNTRHIEYNGNFYTVRELSNLTGVKICTINSRLKKNLSIDQVVSNDRLKDRYGRKDKV